ncbi:chorismate mutase aro7 [Sporothrix curviconia]|uniref:Chorismate mutase n=1 Tax=Sporothrix curviconia TaxID=1260050 RepID=A0ABP0CPM4_9PEZI
MDSSVDSFDPAKALDLSRIRDQLIRLEDTITFHLIERAQFPLNKSIYEPGAVQIRDAPAVASVLTWPLSVLAGKRSKQYSFMDWYLSQQEALQSRIRRFESPDENPFFPEAVQAPILKPLNYPDVLHPNDVVVNDRIKQYYVETLLPQVCADFGRGDRGETQENYGSSATCDIAVLQALSRRIHFGKFVAESKFRSETEKFTALILAEDREGLGEAIVNKKVEQMILQRMRRKVETFGQEVSADGVAAAPATANKLNVDAVVELYEKFVIPVTKDVEVEYLMQRLQTPPPTPWYAALRKSNASETLLWSLTTACSVLAVATVALRWVPRK